MTVYVDNVQIPAAVQSGVVTHDSMWSHLTADTQDELHEFAHQLGLKRSYFQPGKAIGDKEPVTWHYDVTKGMRFKALKLGAQEIDNAGLADLMARRRAELDGPQKPAVEPPYPPPCHPGIPGNHQNATPQLLDRLAGEAFRDRRHDEAIGYLSLARMAFPDLADHWTDRESQVRAAIARRAPAQPELEAGA
jgi:Protein of unknown function (DUF4031)